MILIAGGAGYIGSHTNKTLNQAGCKTVVFDNLSTGHREFVKWGKFVEGDLASIEQIRDCFRKHPIETVMHFSAFANVGKSVADPGKYYRNNVVNTVNLLDVMREFEVKYFIFSSTAATFGTPVEIPITEEHLQNPITPYGQSKLMVESILKDYDQAYGIKHVNLRYFNAAGADPDGEIGERHDPETHLIPLAIHAALDQREAIQVFGGDYATADGTCVRDYIHVNDLADAHIKALDYLKRTGESNAFNLGNGVGFSVREVIEKVRRISGRDLKVEQAARRPGDPATLISSSTKASEILGWRPEFHEIDTIIQTAWNWHRS
jgi:UDP-glucose 4-epimerase